MPRPSDPPCLSRERECRTNSGARYGGREGQPASAYVINVRTGFRPGMCTPGRVSAMTENVL